MVLRVLVETGFLLSLNPRNRRHSWGLGVLRDAGAGRFILFISPLAAVELSLILRSRGVDDRSVGLVLDALDSIIRRFVKPVYPLLELKHLAYSAELRLRYSELTFFDSVHAAIAILEDLVYYDLDETVRGVIASEVGSSKC